MNETNLKLSQEFLDEVLNGRNLDAMDRLIAEDFVELDPTPGQGPGREGLRQVIAMLQRAFPDLHWYADEQISDGDKVVTRFHWTGTHQSDFAGIPPTGKSVSVKGVVIDEYRGGLIARSRILSDDLGMMQQLGLIPPPPNPQAAK